MSGSDDGHDHEGHGHDHEHDHDHDHHHHDHSHGDDEDDDDPPSTGFLPISLALSLFVTGLFVLGIFRCDQG